MLTIVASAIGALVFTFLFFAFVFRRVVPANMVHIVQSGRSTVSYGAGDKSGNTYYAWPSWFPRIGVSVSTFPLSNFDIRLSGYEGYDKGRLPFVVDIMAFFRITDSNKAAQRVSSFGELSEQLTGILQGAVRTILANNDLEHIMQDRATLGGEFTKVVDEQLAEWGVATVKAIEFMDIRDSQNSKVIHNIMAKEQSRIDQESRTAVAINRQKAETAEIESARSVELQRQDADQAVGIRTAQKDKEVGIAREASRQEVMASQKVTTEREMEVQRTSQIAEANIARERAIVDAETYHATTTRNAAADLDATKLKANGIAEVGKAEGEAEAARLLAPVQAQIALAEEIGSNEGYQKYLVTIEQVRVGGEVGKAMAAALETADLKVIANSGDVQGGVANLAGILSPAGGTSIAGMLSALSQTDEGSALLKSVVGRLALPTTPVDKTVEG